MTLPKRIMRASAVPSQLLATVRRRHIQLVLFVSLIALSVLWVTSNLISMTTSLQLDKCPQQQAAATAATATPNKTTKAKKRKENKGMAQAEDESVLARTKKTKQAKVTPQEENDSAISRVWTKRMNGFPCYNGQKRLMITDPLQKGFMFQRPMKVGSTTMVGIVLRLAHNRSQRIDDNIKCLHRSMHGTAQSFEYGKRIKSKSFLFTLVRDPTKRAISEFFHFSVSVGRKEPTDSRFLYALRSPKHRHYYLNELTLKPFAGSYHPAISMERIVTDILDSYDFIAVTERLDESLVAMQMMLNLTTKDILYTRARSSGTFSNGYKGRPCFYIMPSFTTPVMKDFLQSEEWQKTIEGDVMLYRAASASLDRTIEALGKAEFNRKLKALQRGLELAERNCKGRVRSMCSEGGIPIPADNRTCFIWGEGCDHDCIDELKLDMN